MTITTINTQCSRQFLSLDSEFRTIFSGLQLLHIGLALGTYLNWKLVARRLRRYSVVAGDAIRHFQRVIQMTEGV